mmetsp:Transcript_109875/g.201312  ORF Transcript_109875/g.201312 Transcript_109875/m.201312 type:complete len:385 (+) Transcript_109875:25-1179(+)
MADSAEEHLPPDAAEEEEEEPAVELEAEPGAPAEVDAAASAPEDVAGAADAEATPEPSSQPRELTSSSCMNEVPAGIVANNISAFEALKASTAEQDPRDSPAEFHSRDLEVDVSGARDLDLDASGAPESCSDVSAEQCFDAGADAGPGPEDAPPERGLSTGSQPGALLPAPVLLPRAALRGHLAEADPRHSRVEEAITALHRDVNKQLRAIEYRITHVEKKQRRLFSECGFPPREQRGGSQPIRAAWRPGGTSLENYAKGHRTSGGGGAWRSPTARRPSRSPSARRARSAAGARRRQPGTSPSSAGSRGSSPTASLRRGRAGKQRRGGSVPLVDHWRLDSPTHSLELRSSSGTTETLFVMEDELQSIKDFLRHSKGHLAQGLYA